MHFQLVHWDLHVVVDVAVVVSEHGVAFLHIIIFNVTRFQKEGKLDPQVAKKINCHISVRPEIQHIQSRHHKTLKRCS